MILNATIQHKRNTAEYFTTNNPVLLAGEPALETDTLNEKIGDGVTAWNSLPYRTAPGSGYVFGGEITTDTTLNSAHKGLKWFRIVGDVVITVPSGLLDINDKPIFYKSTGVVEFVNGAGFSLRGIRDADNRYFINDNHSAVSLIDCSTSECGIIGNLKRGYTGAVTTTSYSTLSEGDINKNVTIIATGFSENTKITVSGAAILNSKTFVSRTEYTVNLDATGTIGDPVTFTYDNGDVTIDTDALTISSSLPLDSIISNWKFNGNCNDSVGSNNGVPNGNTYNPTGKIGQSIIFDDSDERVVIADNDTLSFGANPYSITMWVKFNSTADQWLSNKRGNATNREYALSLYQGVFRWQAWDEDSNGELKTQHTWTPDTNWHQIAITCAGGTSQPKLYIDKVDVGSTSNTGTYTQMRNGLQDLVIGTRSWSLGNGSFTGEMDAIKIWDIELTPTNLIDLFNQENAGIDL